MNAQKRSGSKGTKRLLEGFAAPALLGATQNWLAEAKAGQATHLRGVFASSVAMILKEAHRIRESTMHIVVPDEKSSDSLKANLLALSPELRVVSLAAAESTPFEAVGTDREDTTADVS